MLTVSVDIFKMSENDTWVSRRIWYLPTVCPTFQKLEVESDMGVETIDIFKSG